MEKDFSPERLRKDMRLELRLEAQNAFNHPIFGTPDSSIDDPNFGTITYTSNLPREGQLGVKEQPDSSGTPCTTHKLDGARPLLLRCSYNGSYAQGSCVRQHLAFRRSDGSTSKDEAVFAKPKQAILSLVFGLFGTNPKSIAV
jgi:hypothetical protein